MSELKYEGSIRKLRQLTREIEKCDTYGNLLHSAYKLGSFLDDEVPGWREATQALNTRAELDEADRQTRQRGKR
jgi:hypothetical protein